MKPIPERSAADKRSAVVEQLGSLAGLEDREHVRMLEPRESCQVPEHLGAIAWSREELRVDYTQCDLATGSVVRQKRGAVCVALELAVDSETFAESDPEFV